jgi:hypothetical protein
MKLFAAILLGGFAAGAAGQEPSIDRRMGQALEEFSTVAGAWYLNQRCGFIAGSAAAAFDSDVATINVTLGKGLGDPGILFGIQAAAKTVAASERYAGCDDEAKSIVMSRVAHAHEWAKRIRSAEDRETQASQQSQLDGWRAVA